MLSNDVHTARCVDTARIEAAARELLLAIGEDPERPGIADTPKRYARWWKEFIAYDPGTTDTTFESVTSDQLVVISGMRVWSLCEHHLLPFWCDISVGYLATDRVLGLSKFGRIAHKVAHQLQLQEQLTTQIADEVQRVTGAPDVAVLGRGEHLCMTMRGIRTPATMTSRVMRGRFAEDAALRAEFVRLIER